MNTNENKIISDVITYSNDSSPNIQQDNMSLMPKTKLAPNSHRIDDILNRYVILSDAHWPSSADAGEVIASYVLPDDLFRASKNLRDKISRFTYFRANFEILLTVNCSAFNKGKLWVFHDPMGNNVGSRGFQVTDSLTRATGFPGVKWDIATGKPCTYKVDYKAPLNAIDLVNGEFDLGNLHLVVFGKQTTTTEAPASTLVVKVQVKMTDLQLYLPTDKPISDRYFPLPELDAHSALTAYDEVDTIPSSKPPKEQRPQKNGRNRKRRRRHDNLARNIATLLRCCSGKIPNCNAHTAEGPSSEAEKKSSLGIISGPAAVVESVASALEPIPILGEVAGQVAWAAGLVKGAASFFGFNKEDSLASSSLYENLPAARYTNADGLTNSVSLSMLPNNRITDLKRFGTSADEMDIGYIGSVPQFVTKTSIDVDDASRSLVMAFPVTPALCEEIADGLSVSYDVTNLGFVACQHKFWNGTLNYNFELTKTDLHSVRLRFTYIPGSNILEIDDELIENATSFASSFSQVVEFKKNNSSFSFSVPFQQNRAALAVRAGCLGAKDLVNDTTFQAMCHNGWILITIENPLIAASTVSTDVQCHLSIGCGDDMKFFEPVSDYVTPDMLPKRVPYQDKREDNAPSTEELDNLVAHTFDQETTDEIVDPRHAVFLSINQDASPTTRVDTSTGEAIFGEEYINLRQLTRRFTDLTFYHTRDPTDRIQPSVSTNGLFLDMACFDSVPNENCVLSDPETWVRKTHKTNKWLETSQMRILSHLYRGFAGSRRYQVEAYNSVSSRHFRIGANVTPDFSVGHINEITQFGSDDNKFRSQDFYTNSVFQHTQDGSLNNVLQVTVPYKRTTNFSLITDEYPLKENPRPFLFVDCKPYNPADKFEIKIREAAGDDFTYGMLVGAPRVTKIDANLVVSYDDLATYCYFMGDWGEKKNPEKGQFFKVLNSQGLVPKNTYVLISDINASHVQVTYKDGMEKVRTASFTHAAASSFLEFYTYDPSILPDPTPIHKLTDIRSALQALAFTISDKPYVFDTVSDAGEIVYRSLVDSQTIKYPKLSEFLDTISQGTSYNVNNLEYIDFIEDQYKNLDIIGSTFLGYTVIDFNHNAAQYTLNGGISHGLNVIIANVKSGTYHDWVGPEHWIMQAWLDFHDGK